VEAPALRIGQVAQASGLPVKTVRFYSDEGVIHAVSRSEGGYRLFAPAVVGELSLIRALRTMDVPLPELKRILEVRRQGHCNCNALKSSIQTRIQSQAPLSSCRSQQRPRHDSFQRKDLSNHCVELRTMYAWR
jgi:DNA-binding transcriptional MerR regulator